LKSGLWAILLVAVVVVAGGVALYYANSGRPGSSTVTAPQFPGYHAIATDSNSTIGIDLSLALNSTTIMPGQGQDLQTVVEVLNTLPRVSNVSVANDFPVRPLQPKCLPGDYTPIVIQMYEGNYARSNISSASPLPYILSCPAVFPGSIVAEYYYLFQPDSANATLYGRNHAGNLSSTGQMSLRIVDQISIHQFSSGFPNGTFPAGTYTLMVEDWWGQVVILHFQVV
jgi:hypothetical protein